MESCLGTWRTLKALGFFPKNHRQNWGRKDGHGFLRKGLETTSEGAGDCGFDVNPLKTKILVDA